MSDNTSQCPSGSVAKPEPRKSLPWYKKDKDGWPIEGFVGKPVKSFIRRVCQNIRKVTG